MATDTAAIWKVDRTEVEGSYRFTNLLDHTAWRVVVRRKNGESVAIPGHISYAQGTFEQRLAPGCYWLTWETTVELLAPRDGEPVRPALQSAPFVLPMDRPSLALRPGTPSQLHDKI